jgi:AraC-like DNA-binding protein
MWLPADAVLASAIAQDNVKSSTVCIGCLPDLQDAIMLRGASRDGLKKRDMHYRRKEDPHNGLLHLKASTPLPSYWRYLPSGDLEPFVEHYWTIEWDLSEPTRRETLPYPSAHIILEPGVAALSGVSTRKYSRVLEGRSRVLGVKFLPGGLRPFVASRVSAFTDKVVPLGDVFGRAGAQLDARVLQHADHHAAIAVMEDFLRSREPSINDALALVRHVAERIAQDRDIRAVAQLASEFSVSERTLQRLFGEYVGVSPKWMIRRYRLQEAATRMAAAEAVDWPQLALDLGYADQAHFIRDFKRIVGLAPAEYFRAMR